MVGYKVRFTDNLSPGASVKLMTDGILLAETQTDPLLKAYDTLIIDEAHERSLNIDFLLGYLKEIPAKRADLKLIVTSATIDADRFARHFGSEEARAGDRSERAAVSGRSALPSGRGRKPGDQGGAGHVGLVRFVRYVWRVARRPSEKPAQNLARSATAI